MKKTLLFALVLGLAVLFAVPAFAFKIESGKDVTFYFGALIYTDLGVWNRDADNFKTSFPGQTERTELVLDMTRNSRIRGVLESGNVGAYWELRLGANKQNAALGSADFLGNGGAYRTEGAKLYGYYKFGNFTLLAGKTDGHIISVAPYQNLGKENNDHNAGYGWGAINDTRSAQIRFSQDISKTFGYDISLVQPDYYVDNGTGQVALTATGARNSLGTFPLAAFKARMKFGAVSMMPAAWLQYVKWNDLPAQPGNKNPDDNLTSWGAVLPVVVKAGAFTGTFQVAYGLNMAGPLSQESSFQSYRRVNGSIKNTTGWNGFFDLAFTAGAVTPHFFMGYDRAQNDDVYFGDKYNDRLMAGVGINWKITDGFYVVPEFTYYDYGKNVRLPNTPSLGKEWLGGVQFQFVF